jgi:hypothetical protein
MRFADFSKTGPVFARWLVRNASRIEALPSLPDEVRNSELEKLRKLATAYPFAERAEGIARAFDALREAERYGINKELLSPYQEVADELSAALGRDEDQWIGGDVQ